MSQYCDNFKFSENNQDHFVMGPVSDDSFQFWQGLRGPYFVPAIDQEGWLSWTNNGGLPNPQPVRIVGRDGRGITLTGYCETVADLPEDPEQGEAWAVGEEEPFECYAWFGEWVDMGLLFPPGPPGQDGVSPEVTITDIPGGHTVKITDKDHPTGQTFNVMDGQDGDPGPGVPAGGSAGQYLKKASATDYDGEWDTLGAGDVAYDDSLTYESGTVGEELSAQKNTLNSLDDDKAEKTDLAPTRTGATNTGSQIEKGKLFYLNGTLCIAKQTIANGSQFTSGTNYDTVSGGGLNVYPRAVANGNITANIIIVDITDAAVDSVKRTVVLFNRGSGAQGFSYIATNTSNNMYSLTVRYTITDGTLSFSSCKRGQMGSSSVVDSTVPIINAIYEL